MLFKLFTTFMKIGITTFGGGYAMLPILRREVCDRLGWATEEEILDYFAISQCTPGVIMINTATFIGVKQRGVLGGIAATLGVIFPSLVLVVLIALFVEGFAENELVQSIMSGVSLAVCGLVTVTILRLVQKSVKDAAGWVIFLAAFAGSFFLGISPVVVIALAALAGITIGAARENSKKRRK